MYVPLPTALCLCSPTRRLTWLDLTWLDCHSSGGCRSTKNTSPLGVNLGRFYLFPFQFLVSVPIPWSIWFWCSLSNMSCPALHSTTRIDASSWSDSWFTCCVVLHGITPQYSAPVAIVAASHSQPSPNHQTPAFIFVVSRVNWGRGKVRPGNLRLRTAPNRGPNLIVVDPRGFLAKVYLV